MGSVGSAVGCWNMPPTLNSSRRGTQKGQNSTVSETKSDARPNLNFGEGNHFQHLPSQVDSKHVCINDTIVAGNVALSPISFMDKYWLTGKKESSPWCLY